MSLVGDKMKSSFRQSVYTQNTHTGISNICYILMESILKTLLHDN